MDTVHLDTLQTITQSSFPLKFVQMPMPARTVSINSPKTILIGCFPLDQTSFKASIETSQKHCISAMKQEANTFMMPFGLNGEVFIRAYDNG